jgi:hypothetical protein
MCWPDEGEQNECASLALDLRFAFRSKVRCGNLLLRPFIAFIDLYGTPYHKGRFIIFSRVELVNFPVFIWSDRLSFAKRSAVDLKFRLASKAVSIFPSTVRQ